MEIEKLIPECKDNLWGGDKLIKYYGKKTDKNPCAESWELSYHKDGLTKLENGKTLQEVATAKDLGSNVEGFPFFPVLIKFIDAKQNLSVQVHPSDNYALKNENSFGKTEMWYIVEAEKGAKLYLGFKENVTKDRYEQAIKENTLINLLNGYEVKKGECYFIPSGTVHAIGSGCLICEIQQNSNLTYRVYDYGRVDKNGKPRELHIDKALAVSNLNKYTHLQPIGDLVGFGKYFTAHKLEIKDAVTLETNGTTFNCVTVVSGNGFINDKQALAGDSYFVPANFGKYTLKGELTVIMTEIRKYYVGIDLGGTFIKGGIVDDQGKIILNDNVPTESEGGSKVVAQNIAKLCSSLMERCNLQSSDIQGVGMGVPGMIDSKNGEVIYSNNLNWEHFKISEEVEKLIGLKVKIANDANVAALGETKFGCGKEYHDTILVTLGTGVGGGVVIDGKLFEGNKSAGAELGHMVIVDGGNQCTCGNKGCLEAYASATALIKATKNAMENHKDSKMWEIGSVDNVTGKTAFDYKDTDVYAKEVVDNYIEKLGVGLVNFANIFRPQAIMLGGGVCAQGDVLVKPLQQYMDKHIFAGARGPQVKILIAQLGNDAGLLGGAALLME